MRLLKTFAGPLAGTLFFAVSAHADITTGLIHRWTFDETSGLTAHDSVGGNDATLSGFPVNQATWVPGKVGGSLNFFASSNYVLTDSQISSNEYTIDFWLKVNGPGGINPRLVTPRDGNGSWVAIGTELHKGVALYPLIDPNPPGLVVWENYAITVDLGHQTGAVYRDGVQVAAGTFIDVVPQARWVFGHNQDPVNTNDTLNGQLDDIRIYNRILTVGDIAQLVAVPEPGSVTLAAGAMVGLFAWSWRHRKKAAGRDPRLSATN